MCNIIKYLFYKKKNKNGVSIIQIFVISILLGWEQIDRGRLRLNPQINPTRSGYKKKLNMMLIEKAMIHSNFPFGLLVGIVKIH